MSSLAAVQADGYYKPEEKARTKQRASQFSRTGKIVFELMYKGKCLSCGAFMGKGTRFNAKKTQVGMYLSSKIWEFQMNCKGKGCSERLVVRTDPQHAEFIFVSGMKQIGGPAGRSQDDGDQTTNSTNNSGTSSSTATGSRSIHSLPRDSLRTDNKTPGLDAMDRLEQKKELQEQLDADAAQIKILKQQADQGYGNNVTSNARLRQAHRVVRHEKESLARQGKKLGIGGPLLPKSRQDEIVARRERTAASIVGRHHKQKRKRKAVSVTKQSIFKGKKKSRSGSSSRSSRSSRSSMARGAGLERALHQLPRSRMTFASGSGSSGSSSSSSKIVLRKR